jgi:hypothetical protein
MVIAWPFRSRKCASKGMLIAMRQLISEYVGHDLGTPEQESHHRHDNGDKEANLKGCSIRKNAAEESDHGDQDHH